jgi:hypothetical protein
MVQHPDRKEPAGIYSHREIMEDTGSREYRYCARNYNLQPHIWDYNHLPALLLCPCYLPCVALQAIRFFTNCHFKPYLSVPFTRILSRTTGLPRRCRHQDAYLQRNRLPLSAGFRRDFSGAGTNCTGGPMSCRPA